MAYTLEQGSQALNREDVDAMVKQIAAQTYKFKQAVSIVGTDSLDNTFFREDPTVLTGSGTANIKGVPFGATIPTAHPKWERLSSRVLAFKIEDNIAWEIMKGSVIDMQARTIIKLTAAVVKTVDDYIYDQLSQSNNFAQSLEIQSYSISLDKYWNGASAAIVKDLGAARRLIGQKFYDNTNTLTFVSSRDMQSINDFIHNKGAQYEKLGEEAAVNGRILRLAGTTLVENQSTTASYALMVTPKICATYKEFVPLTTVTIEDPLKSWTVRVAEEGVVERTDPLAIVVIRGTQGVDGL